MEKATPPTADPKGELFAPWSMVERVADSVCMVVQRARRRSGRARLLGVTIDGFGKDGPILEVVFHEGLDSGVRIGLLLTHEVYEPERAELIDEYAPTRLVGRAVGALRHLLPDLGHPLICSLLHGGLGRSAPGKCDGDDGRDEGFLEVHFVAPVVGMNLTGSKGTGPGTDWQVAAKLVAVDYIEQTKRIQYRTSRAHANGASADPTAIVLHTAEVPTSWRVADLRRLIATRSDAAGSYHGAADVDGKSEQYVPWGWEAFHISARNGQLRGNALGIGISFVCRASDWGGLPAAEETAMLEAAARLVVQASEDLDTEYGYAIENRLLTPAEYWAGEHGIITHAALQANRTDPGRNFPMDRFLGMLAEIVDEGTTRPEPEPARPPDANPWPMSRELAAEYQQALADLGYPIVIDGAWGPKSEATMREAFGQLSTLQRFRSWLSAE